MDTTDLQKPEIRKLLNTEIGFFNLHSCFINYYLSKRLFNETRTFTNAPKDKFSVGSLLKLFKSNIVCFFKRNPLKKEDMLFISRYREKQVPDIKTDYLFDSVLNYTDNHYNVALLSLNYFGHYNRPYNQNYNLIDGVTPFIIIKSILTSLNLYIGFARVKSNLESDMKYSLISFFSMKNLFLWCLNGFTLKNIYKKLTPRLIVANDDMQLLKPPGEKVKFITVQSAHMLEELEKKRSQLHSVLVSEEEKADIFCVSGSFFRSIKEKYPADAEKIVITGQPRFDELFQLKRDYESNLEFKKDPEKINILWATQTHSLPLEENKRNVRVMANILRKMPHITLTIKLHPGEDQEATLYADLQENFGNVNILQGTCNLWDSLLLCDIMVTKNSTSTIEAAILEKDIIMLDLSENRELNENQRDYLKNDISLEVCTESGLEKAITDLTENQELSKEFKKSRKNFIREYNYSTDGDSSLRVFKIMEQFLV